MIVKGIPVQGRRLAWLLLSIAAMFMSAYSVFGWMGVVGRISGWTGLPQYTAQMPRLQTRAEFWLGLAVGLPFLAAWFLGLGRKERSNQIVTSGTLPVTYPRDLRPWLSSAFEYGVRLGVSILGALAFAVCLFLVGMLLYKFGLRAN